MVRKSTFCEIFGLVRFSTFSTASVKNGSRDLVVRCLLCPGEQTLCSFHNPMSKGTHIGYDWAVGTNFT
jgi:hypothetical protein